MNRFFCIPLHFLSALFTCGACLSISAQTEPVIMTINGAIPTDSMGTSLIHEHVFLDWSGASQIDENLWDEQEAKQVILPYLNEMRNQGVMTFLECTPAYLGRNPDLLLELSRETGLQILTNTGYYAAREYEHLPTHFNELSVTELANLWISEFTNGIQPSGVKPGFIKIGVDSKEKLTEIDQKLVQAAAITHLNTGLTIVGHTGDDTTASQQLDILAANGVSPEAFVWTHAQSGTKNGHLRLARTGTWVSLDGMGWITPAEDGDSSALYKYVDFLVNLKENGLLDKTLISHDAGWYTVGSEDQTGYKSYDLIFTLVMPALRQRGFTAEDFNLLMIENPGKAYSIKVRRLKD